MPVQPRGDIHLVEFASVHDRRNPTFRPKSLAEWGAGARLVGFSNEWRKAGHANPGHRAIRAFEMDVRGLGSNIDFGRLPHT